MSYWTSSQSQCSLVLVAHCHIELQQKQRLQVSTDCTRQVALTMMILGSDLTASEAAEIHHV